MVYACACMTILVLISITFIEWIPCLHITITITLSVVYDGYVFYFLCATYSHVWIMPVWICGRQFHHIMAVLLKYCFGITPSLEM